MDLARDRANASTGASADQSALQSASKESAQSSTARASDQSPFPGSDSALVRLPVSIVSAMIAVRIALIRLIVISA
jgi:hypothetical protein